DAIVQFTKSDTGQMIGRILLIIGGVVAAIAFLPATITFALATLSTIVYTKWDQITEWIQNAWNSTLNFLLKAAILGGKLLITYLFPIAGIFLFKEEIGQALDWIWNKLQSIPFFKHWMDQFVDLKNQAKLIFSNIMDSINEGLGSLFNFNNLAQFFSNSINNMIEKINYAMNSVPLIKNVWPNIPFIEARAMGGPVESNVPYLVGENGPELRIFEKSGSIIPNDKLSSAIEAQPISASSLGKGISFNIDRIEISGSSSTEQATNFWSEIKRLARENENETRISLGLAPA
ncbi:hypothetical protein ACT533_11550, partial [Leptospira santarosai]